MSARLSLSSTKYGPSVSAGVTMQVGVGTGRRDVTVAVGVDVGADPVWVPPEQAATMAE